MSNKRVVIIGGGIAGLCAGVYARRCGYDAKILEMGAAPGGLATSWRRGNYTFETCLHWLLGSNPNGPFHAEWQEVFDIDRLTFIDPEEYVHLETDKGESIALYTNVDRMESGLLKVAPHDEHEIRHLATSVRRLGQLALPDPSAPWPRNWLSLLRMVPFLPLLREWSNLSCNEYSRRFSHPLVRNLFRRDDDLSAIAVVLSLAWMNMRNAAYAIGGAQAIIRAIVEQFRSLGGELRLGAKVEKVLVENDVAVGVELANGETARADWVISAADGHATIYNLLNAKYKDEKIDNVYGAWQTFPSYVQVSLGIAKSLADKPPFLIRVLDTPINVDPETQSSQVSFRFFHFDPTFAPDGKTAVTCFLPTRNFQFWVDLQQRNPPHYQQEKDHVARQVIDILERSVPDLRGAIEEIDVSTPATVIRFTGNWRGSMEGWILGPGMSFRSLPQTLPGLQRFLMVGQWVLPGGGLPSGLMTARSAIRQICKEDRVDFLPANLARQQAA